MASTAQPQGRTPHRSRPQLWRVLCLAALLTGTACSPAEEPTRSEQASFTVETVVTGLVHPWSVAFLPGATADAIDALVTERGGALRRIRAGKLQPEPIAGVPPVAAVGQGGLLDVILDPAFADNGVIYLSAAAGDDRGSATTVFRARLVEDRLAEVQRIFAVAPLSGGGHHFGSRLVFGDDGLLYLSAGERGDRRRAQDLGDGAGAIHRIRADGSVPADNPFIGERGVVPTLYSYGHRNPQGMTKHPVSGAIWAVEHGPRGGDEANVILPGRNYGWPEITYGREYATFQPIGQGTERADVQPPEQVWIPSIAPSGLAFYTGDAFPAWRGDLFTGSLKFAQLVRLEVDETGTVMAEERLLDGVLGRIRDVRNGPGGRLYLLTDASNGGLYALVPATP